ncbi:hypothetical protein BC830DRAFT_1080570 [Chytriomyces sp. MP71]|nr:hypothetical protein BC830DRAFT_1080570 [Chytriomyces sp. MP71]
MEDRATTAPIAAATTAATGNSLQYCKSRTLKGTRAGQKRSFDAANDLHDQNIAFTARKRRREDIPIPASDSEHFESRDNGAIATPEDPFRDSTRPGIAFFSVDTANFARISAAVNGHEEGAEVADEDQDEAVKDEPSFAAAEDSLETPQEHSFESYENEDSHVNEDDAVFISFGQKPLPLILDASPELNALADEVWDLLCKGDSEMKRTRLHPVIIGEDYYPISFRSEYDHGLIAQLDRLVEGKDPIFTDFQKNSSVMPPETYTTTTSPSNNVNKTTSPAPRSSRVTTPVSFLEEHVREEEDLRVINLRRSVSGGFRAPTPGGHHATRR